MSAAKNSTELCPQENPAQRLEGKFLTFCLKDEEYGLGILKVREIIGLMPIRTMPRTPSFVKGVINLRGKVIPVVDLRLKFGLEEAELNEKTSIIVVDIKTPVKDIIHIGIVVDFVSEVVSIKADEIEPAPPFGGWLSSDYILGMAKIGKSVKILLNIDRILALDNYEFMFENWL